MKRKKKDVEELEEQKKENRTFHVILVTSLTALLLVSFIGFGYGLGAIRIVDDMQQHIARFEKENTGDNDGTGKLDIKSRTVQYLYNEVAFDMDKSKEMWQYDDKNEDVVALNVVGMNLNASKAHYVDGDTPAYEGYENGLVQGEVSKYFTKDEVESVYKIVYGKDAVLDTTKDINVEKDGISVYHFDSNSGNYYAYHKNGGHVSGPTSETGKLNKAEEDGNRIKVYQKVDYVDESDSSKNAKYYYVYNFEREADGLYKFINRTKENIK